MTLTAATTAAAAGCWVAQFPPPLLGAAATISTESDAVSMSSAAYCLVAPSHASRKYLHGNRQRLLHSASAVGDCHDVTVRSRPASNFKKASLEGRPVQSQRLSRWPSGARLPRLSFQRFGGMRAVKQQASAHNLSRRSRSTIAYVLYAPAGALSQSASPPSCPAIAAAPNCRASTGVNRSNGYTSRGANGVAGRCQLILPPRAATGRSSPPAANISDHRAAHTQRQWQCRSCSAGHAVVAPRSLVLGNAASLADRLLLLQPPAAAGAALTEHRRSSSIAEKAFAAAAAAASSAPSTVKAKDTGADPPAINVALPAVTAEPAESFNTSSSILLQVAAYVRSSSVEN